ncbi:hypothetical protein BJX63DRAFT_377164 [Aspergillus granulosus]|uniref:Uncharacterized protein n=1 Tax=Aspergillus granulosus TaxID=176169 RepID=A0ABR4I5R8_9EURO
MKALLHFFFLKGIALYSLLTPSSWAQDSDTCGEDCQAFIEMGIAFEHGSYAHEPLDDFYTIPESFNLSMKPGTLLRIEEHTDITN